MVDRLRDERVRLQEQQHFLARILAVSPLGIVLLSTSTASRLRQPGGERLLQQPAALLLGTAARRGPRRRSPRRSSAWPTGESAVVPLWGGRRVRCQRGAFVDRGFPRCFMSSRS